MPEGPEVKRITESLAAKLIGKWVLNITVAEDSKFYRHGIKGIELVQSNPLPAKVTNVWCHGKQIFMELTNEKGVTYLNNGLGMTGGWTWGGSKYLRLSMHMGTITDNVIPISIIEFTANYCDQRNFGNVSFLTRQEVTSKMRSMGPDLLSQDVTREMFLSIARNKRIQHMQICCFIMESKRRVSGVGNYVKSDALRLARIRPDRTLGSLSDNEIDRVRIACIQVLTESYTANGHTIKDYIDPEGRIGSYQKKIYKREVDFEGHRVVTGTFKDGRTTYWAPDVQV